MHLIFTCSSQNDVTEYNNLCQICKAKYDYGATMEYEVMCQHLALIYAGMHSLTDVDKCSCENEKKYEYISLSISVPEIKIPSDCVYCISIYVNDSEIDFYDEDLKPTLTFSIYRSMDIYDRDMKALLINNKRFVEIVDIYVKETNPQFKGLVSTESYIKYFKSLYKDILESKDIILEQKRNPHIKKKGKK